MEMRPATVDPGSLTPRFRALFEAQQAALETLRAENAALSDRNRATRASTLKAELADSRYHRAPRPPTAATRS